MPRKMTPYQAQRSPRNPSQQWLSERRKQLISEFHVDTAWIIKMLGPHPPTIDVSAKPPLQALVDWCMSQAEKILRKEEGIRVPVVVFAVHTDPGTLGTIRLPLTGLLDRKHWGREMALGNMELIALTGGHDYYAVLSEAWLLRQSKNEPIWTETHPGIADHPDRFEVVTALAVARDPSIKPVSVTREILRGHSQLAGRVTYLGLGKPTDDRIESGDLTTFFEAPSIPDEKKAGLKKDFEERAEAYLKKLKLEQ